jgi:hypothetical protein
VTKVEFAREALFQRDGVLLHVVHRQPEHQPFDVRHASEVHRAGKQGRIVIRQYEVVGQRTSRIAVSGRERDVGPDLVLDSSIVMVMTLRAASTPSP